MSIAYKIRAAQTGDCVAIAALLTELNREEGYAALADTTHLSQALFAEMREVQLAAWVAECAGKVVGVLLYYPGYDTLSASVGYHLADIVVTQIHRQSGIGRALMKALAVHARETKKEWVSLTVLKQNATARAFYQALGMVEVDVDFFAIGKASLAQL